MLNLKIASRLGIANKYDKQLKGLTILIKKAKIRLRSEPKVFVIGFNKTGTTTLFYALEELGYFMSNQHDFERLYNRYAKGELTVEDILKKCSEYEVFQDIPFSLPGFYKHVDKKYPKCKFVLTVRSESNIWYKSFENYYGGQEKLKNDLYLEKGFLYNTFKTMFQSEDFKKETCMKVYEEHIEDVKKYFAGNNKRLLVLDVSEKDSYEKLCLFLGKMPQRESFEWKNKTNVEIAE